MSEITRVAEITSNALSDVKLISIRKAASQSSNEHYDIYIRTSWRVRRLTPVPMIMEQVEEEALKIEQAVRQHQADPLSQSGRNNDEPVIAGNSVSIIDKTFISARQEYSLDAVSNVLISGEPNGDFIRLVPVSFGLFVLLMFGVVIIAYTVQVAFHAPTLASYLVGGVFTCGVITLLGLFLNLLYKSPGVWSISVMTPEGLRIIYKSEDSTQATRVEQMIKQELQLK